jgi:hypothetical protein
MTTEFLNDLEKTKIIAFRQDEQMINAVKKVLLKAIYNQGVMKPGEKIDPLLNPALNLAFVSVRNEAVISDEELGRKLRGLAEGLNYLEVAFNEMLALKVEDKKEEEEKNKAI